MKVITCVNGYLEENCYILETDNNIIIIDPGSDAEKIMSCFKGSSLPVSAILLTHGHFDHIGAARELRDVFDAKIYINENDADMLSDVTKSLAGGFIPSYEGFDADVVFSGDTKLDINGDKIDVMYTPGHTMGSSCFFAGDLCFCGDTVFNLSIGRTDFPGSSPAAMADSLRKLKGIGRDMKVYPGHGPETTLDYEKMNNPYFTCI